jgi:hypothetical protein
MDWMGLFLPRINRKEPKESLNPANSDDLERLEELKEQGSRLNLPHPVRGFLVFESEEIARQAMEPLEKGGFSCTVRSSPDGTWVLTAVTNMVPTSGAITKLRETFEAVTSSHHGTYRGWDAPAIY